MVLVSGVKSAAGRYEDSERWRNLQLGQMCVEKNALFLVLL